MALEISSTLLARVLAEAAASPELEVCGLLFGTGTRITDAQSCRNVAPDPRTAFEIDPTQLIGAHRAARSGGPAIVGCYHSHPHGPAAPSPRDAAAAAPDGSVWLIVGGGGIGWYRTVDNGRYHGRFEAVNVVLGESIPLVVASQGD